MTEPFTDLEVLSLLIQTYIIGLITGALLYYYITIRRKK